MGKVRFLGCDCTIRNEEYANGGTCLRLVDEDGEDFLTATSWIPGLAAGEVAVKNYSENEGILDVLVDAGIVLPPHRHEASGFVRFPVCRLADGS